MIWYVATLIASVISTRGLAAQGELKCSSPALPLPMFSAPSSPPQAPQPLRAPRFPSGEARAPVRRAPGHSRGRPGAAGWRGKGEDVRAHGLPGSREKTPWDRGRLRTPSAPGGHTGVPSLATLAGAAVSWSAGESAAFLTPDAGEFAGVRAGCSALAPPLRGRALAGRSDPEPWDSGRPRLRDWIIGLRAPSAPDRAPPDHKSSQPEVESSSQGGGLTETRERRRTGVPRRAPRCVRFGLALSVRRPRLSEPHLSPAR